MVMAKIRAGLRRATRPALDDEHVERMTAMMAPIVDPTGIREAVTATIQQAYGAVDHSIPQSMMELLSRIR